MGTFQGMVLANVSIGSSPTGTSQKIGFIGKDDAAYVDAASYFGEKAIPDCMSRAGATQRERKACSPDGKLSAIRLQPFGRQAVRGKR